MDGAGITHVCLLDGFAVRCLGTASGSAVVDLPRGVERLVAYLGLCSARRRAAAAGELWPDVSEARAHASLRSALWRLHKVAPGLVTASAGTVALARSVRVDVWELVAWAGRVMDPDIPVEEVTPGYGQRGELLPGWYEDWVLLERERLRQLRIHALEAAAQKLTAAGRYGEAVQAAYAAVRCEPLRESAHRALVRVHLAEGNLIEAARAFESFRILLATELGVPPTSQMLQLVRDLPRCRQLGEGDDHPGDAPEQRLVSVGLPSQGCRPQPEAVPLEGPASLAGSRVRG